MRFRCFAANYRPGKIAQRFPCGLRCALRSYSPPEHAHAREVSSFARGPEIAGWSFLLVVLDQREDVEASQFFSAVEESELDGEGGAFDRAAELLDEFGGRGGGATGGEQVVANDHALAGLDGVFVDFERVRAVFQRIGDAGGFGGKLIWFSNRNETCVEPVRQSGSKNEAARFDPRYHVNGATDVVLAEAVNQHVKAKLVLQQRGQVVKENARLRVVRHFANQLLQIVHSNVSSLFDSSLVAQFRHWC